MPASLPLAGLRIAVTRPREQAAQLASGIEREGGHVIPFPLLDIAPAADPQALRERIAHLDEYDLAIFISPNAVRYGMAAIRAHDGFPAGLQCAAVGQGSARVLREAGVTDIIAPQDRFDSEALLALPAMQEMRNRRVVIFRGDGGRPLLGDTLQQRGAQVDYAECYRRLPPSQDISTLFAAHPDAITVTSSEALGYLTNMPGAQHRATLTALPLFVSHARIAEIARGLDWRNVITTASGDDGLLAGLVAWAGKRIPS
ncbi:MAG: uroporphyrinogen-III synthase [Gallionellaceae bacterium]|nr:uroporphyrinogen-III synthase [Gallionellaceae bacterium]